MLSMDYDLTIKDFSPKEIGYATLVRTEYGNLRVKLTNDGQVLLSKLKVRVVVESYVGQEKPQLFQWLDEQITDIPPQGMVPLIFRIMPIYPGLLSAAVYVTDATNNAVIAKRGTESSYERGPVRWWFHVVDDISIETLRALKELVAAQRKGMKK